jgi:ABC-2 type transport system ATP-binding protein
VRPSAAEWRRAWRRGGRWRVWDPPGTSPSAGETIAPDLQDAVTVAALARELTRADDGTDPVAGTRPETDRVAGPAVPGSAGRPRPAGPLAECVAVSRQFGQLSAVRDVDLQVEAGEIVGLLGANGAGKTTLIKMLLGLLGTSAGRVALFGQPPSRDTRRRIGYLPQGLGLYEDLTAAENLEFSAAVFGGRPHRPDRLAGEFTSPVDSFALELGSLAAVPVGRLPLGLQRRLAFAEALAHHPQLLFLDEPTSGVDPLGRARLWETIRAAADDGAGVLVTTHYMEEAGECDRLVIMADGGVVAEGTAADIIGAARVTVVAAASWAAAFRRLEDAGLSVALAGRALRVPGVGPDAVRRTLGDLQARVFVVPATLEERFFELTSQRGVDVPVPA